ncbi:MAG TPA: NHLP family bacteriocin export ABC transporter peptidase/permease/ATPase subunit [Inquilinus sp.]|nr:NHLP family bacteriocin export ABC transporter peptidase/permease/ATPase subunit [Inquilinus sp.]
MFALGRSRRVKTPTVLQMEAAECGAAALGIILGYYGRWIPLSELRVSCGVSRDGSNAVNVLAAARALGMDARGFRRPPEEVLAGRFPVIAFWRSNHFVVVEGVRRNTVFLNDPAAGPRWVTVDEFTRDFSGVTLEIWPTADFRRGGRPQGTWRLIAGRLTGAGPAIALLTLTALPLGLLSVVMPAFTRVFIDNVLVAELESWRRPMLAAFALVIALQAGFLIVQQRALAKLQNWLAITQSPRFVWHLLTVPIAYFAERQTGDFAQRLQANDRIATLIGGQLGAALLQTIVACATGIAMVLYQPWLALVAITAALTSALSLAWVSRLRANAVERMRSEQSKLYGQTITTLQNIENVKSIGAENESFARWAGHQGNLLNVEQRLSAIDAMTSVAPQLLFGLANGAVFGIGALLVMNGALSLGSISAFLMLMMSFTAAVQTLVEIVGELQESRGDLVRLQDTYSQSPDWRFQLPSQPLRADPVAGRIEVRGVTFGYDRFRPPLIDGFDLKIEPGGSIALVGGSGSGKSTLGRLCSGLLRPWSGEVLIDGTPIVDWDRDRLAASVGVVEQDIVLFDGTIRDNVTLWDPSIPQQTVFQVLKEVDLLDKVMSLPGNLQSVLAEGGRNLSGGQRQRLDIARALVRQPRVLILDEATSALDAVSERDVLAAVRRLGCTVIMVAHRLSTIRDCDEIIVLSEGKVVERGRHEELVRLGGVYSKLLEEEA